MKIIILPSSNPTTFYITSSKLPVKIFGLDKDKPGIDTMTKIQAVIAILDFAYSVHSMSVFEEDLKMDHRMIQQLILKMSEGIE